MRKKENLLYKDGIKNADGYKFSVLKPKEKIVIILVIVSFVIFAICSVLDDCGVVSKNYILTKLGIIDGVSRQNCDFAVYCLDVGQSDCTVIISNDEVLMIDTGTANQLNTIRASLKSLGISTIDYMIITHPHDDHMGSARYLIDDYDVRNILMCKLLSGEDSNYSYQQLINSIHRNNVNVIDAEPGLTLKIGNAWACVFAPMKTDDELNNNSIVVKVVYEETSFLFQGDAEATVEKDLIDSQFNIDSDILKLGHHGSNTSSTVDFLEEVTPVAGIISCGIDNTYSHPNGNVIDRLDSLGIDAYATSLSGNITIVSDGINITVITEDGKNTVYNQ